MKKFQPYLLILSILVFTTCGSKLLNVKNKDDALKKYDYLYQVSEDSFTTEYNKLITEDTVFYQLMDSCQNYWPELSPPDMISALKQLDTVLCDLTKFDMIRTGNLMFTYNHWFYPKWKMDGNSELEKYCNEKLLWDDRTWILIIVWEAMKASAYNEPFDLNITYRHHIQKYNVQDTIPIKNEYKKIEKFVNEEFDFFNMKEKEKKIN